MREHPVEEIEKIGKKIEQDPGKEVTDTLLSLTRRAKHGTGQLISYLSRGLSSCPFSRESQESGQDNE